MAFDITATVEDIATPANTVIITNEADGDVTVTCGATSRKVDGAALQQALKDVNNNSASYARTIQVADVDTPANNVEISTGTSGINVDCGGTARDCLYKQLLKAAQAATNDGE